MLLPEPNDTFRVSRRYGLEGFERFLEASIERFESPTPVLPSYSDATSLDGLALITDRSTRGAYRLSLYSDEVSSETLILPWELYDRQKGDIFVFGPKVKSRVGLADRVGPKSYRRSSQHAIAVSDEPLGFLYYHGHDAFETVEGDLLLVPPERMLSIARAAVRPEKVFVRTLN